MVISGTMLQARYRVLRHIGGGGMGTVYQADDLRLPGRSCAIKEMTPAQIAPQDRNWAINAFRQEAQMLASLRHRGLTAVTDFFAEAGCWYLVMDYVEGQTLEKRLEQTGGRFSTTEALQVMEQLFEVLEYLHAQSPPVVFRDLKPSNVMCAPQGKIKLIDFGIARFFKQGQTRDTIQLGTPGYAAPEQYGGMGQSDPRADVYSLGVLLLQMITGFDPTTAITPFPLPQPDSLMAGIPPHIAAVIRRATQLQPEARYPSVQEMRRALLTPSVGQSAPPSHTQQARTKVFIPSAPSPSPAETPPKKGKGKGLWIGLGIAALLLLVCGGGTFTAFSAGLLNFNSDDTTPRVETVESSATEIMHATEEITEQPSSSTATREIELTPILRNSQTNIGHSVQGRDLSVTSIGYDGGTNIVVIGSIQGDQQTTRDLVEALIQVYQQNINRVPADVQYHFIPTINPDGNAQDSRYNAHQVDLNRNWGTSDWKSNAAVPGYPQGKAEAGGAQPFSEPETQALRDFLLQIQSRSATTSVVLYHASVHRSTGEVYPGGNSAMGVTQAYATATDYDIEYSWKEYVTSGEAVTWCEEESILAIDVVIPASQSPYTRVTGNQTLLEITMQALESIAQ